MIALWWSSLSVMLKVLWGITLAASLIFLIQSVMTFIGADSGGDFDMDFDTGSASDVDMTDLGHSGMNLYTFRNFVNFCLGFGWTAVLMYEKIPSLTVLFIVAFLVGVALVAAVMYLFKLLSSMQQSGNINVYKSAVGCHGTVYLTIPGERKGDGKVQISINGSIREYNALTDDETIPTGTPIKVVEVLDESTLVVSKLDSLII
ncbi:MAG: hypothetical protein MJY88_09265 [Bacteroidales bacterium]|nr:hypothetical protein [Bacteroidales bacterium]